MRHGTSENRSGITFIAAMIAMTAVAGTVIPAERAEAASEDKAKGDETKRLPYMDTDGGRAGHRFTDEPINEHRLYDFYDRQAAYYLDGHTVPEVLPAYPGTDGGKFGHWGAESSSKNNFRSNRWDEMDMGSVVAGVFRHGQKQHVTKAVTARLGEGGGLSVCFDPQTLAYRELWTNGLVSHSEARWGLMSGIFLEGRPMLTTVPSVGWTADGRWRGGYPSDAIDYRGYHRHGKRVVFFYAHRGAEILDAPWAIGSGAGPILSRSLHFKDGVDQRTVQLFQAAGEEAERQRSDELRLLILQEGDRATVYALRGGSLNGEAKLKLTQDRRVTVELNDVDAGSHLTAYIWRGGADSMDAAMAAMREDVPRDPKSLTKPGGRRWEKTVTMRGERAVEDHGAYQIDRVPVPIENPYNALMFPGGIGFYDNGDAAVCTITGDVWRVSGLESSLKEVTWQRIASGLNFPLGVQVIDNKPFVLGKDQITVLHDRNGDGEADFYENFCNDYRTGIGHQYHTGLQRDAAGNFYFATQHLGVVKVSPDGERVETMSGGIRNPNGVGVRDDGFVVTAAQEGTWTPTSMIVEAREGSFYGLGARRGQEIDPPLGLVPRGVDASTGGQRFIDDERFGPLNGKLLAFSWNGANHYMVLLDEVNGVKQAAAVPLPGDFRAGAHRGKIRPQDGSLYVVCSDGWGGYAVQHGALHRIRYTGEKAYLPTGFHTHRNGIKLTFTQPLDESAAEDVSNYFAQQWEYIYSPSYGSKEYSVRHPEKQGHDPLAIRSAHLMDDARSVFLEIPDIQPVMQAHIHARLKAADGHEFTTNVFPTIHRLDKPLTGFPGYEPIEQEKPAELALRIDWPEPAQAKKDSEDSEPSQANQEPKEKAKSVVIQAETGLSYDREAFRVKPGERIELTLRNTDVMPHNLVVVRRGRLNAVGQAADRLITSANAVQQHYVPQSDDVLHHTRVVHPNQAQTIEFRAPKTPGEYPYVCTFPGHWRVMRGVMIVEE